ncbi:Predicted Peptidoglycan domain-containing protein [Monaibacterium marinum]|uniref:Predicted Peptidoglycan domain-containing protein n=1 Tax=Pontivivens marinum TaxID=1690039 RepID=A0A2C9CQN3_9RHOB|nr:holin-associated N-acetylmuramidase [Monaibacterium marinum]SOH93518.1 Predicted Peptidoglycan domain-containing protein [Monaibacterium marinum]
MDRIDEMIAGIIAREGGFVNDPADPGGPTNLGVTLGTMRSLGLDMNADGQVTVEDVKVLRPTDAARIFRVEYFDKPGLRRLPDALQAPVFDMYVNAGGRAILLLQSVLVKFGAEIAVDGAIGPITAATAHRIAERVGIDLLVDAYGVERRDWYYDLADRRPSSRRFARRQDGGKGGWILRAEEFISANWHLTLQQHRERTASWA